MMNPLPNNRYDSHRTTNSLLHHAVSVAIVLMLVMLSLVAQTTARAEDTMPPVDTEAKAQLDITVGQGGKQIPGMRFDLYQVGSMSSDGQIQPLDAFQDDLPSGRLSEEHIPASTLAEIARKCEALASGPMDTKTTDAHGKLVFGNDGTLSAGAYFVIGHETVMDGETYETLPFLVFLPQWSERASQWLYWVIASPKPEVIGNDAPTPTEPTTPDDQDTPESTPRNPVRHPFDSIMRLLQTGQGLPVIIGAILLVATLAEIVIKMRKNRNSPI